jgi:putative ABC transport system permease protein
MTSLAVGIGASASITSVSTAVLVRPLPYEKPQELVMIWRGATTSNRLVGFRDPRRLTRNLLTPGMALHWREQALPFADFAVFESWQTGPSSRVDLIDETGVERLRGTLATPNLFSVLGVRPAHGRTFREQETGVAIISDRLWRRRFGAKPGVVGTTIVLAAGRSRAHQLVEVIGVLPDRFRFDYPEETEIWLPLTWAAVQDEVQFALKYRAVARLRDHTSVQVAEAAMQVLRDPLDKDPQRESRIWLERVQDYAVGDSRGPLLLVTALTMLVLLSGAINAATVFAASTISRLSEMRIRRALGASHGRLIRQVLTETSIIAVVAGALGWSTVFLAVPALRAVLPANLARVDEIRVDWLTTIYVFGAVVLSTMLAGFVPAWLSARQEQRITDTHTSTVSRAGLQLRTCLLGLQFALVSGLLIAGIMLARSFWNITSVDKGFEANPNVYVAEIQLINPAYRSEDFSTRERDLVRRLKDLAYIEAVSLSSAVPLRSNTMDLVHVLRLADGQAITASERSVDSAYFDAMNIPLISGSGLPDTAAYGGESVALVSRSLATALYPSANPLGKPLSDNVRARIIGVVADVRALSVSEPPMPAYYLRREEGRSNLICVVVRTRNALQQQIAADMRRIVLQVYPEQPVQRLARLDQVLDDSIWDRRAYAVISSAFAIVMLTLAGFGLCGHLSHVVAERVHELAIRSALGASPQQQQQAVLRHIVPALLGGVTSAMVLMVLWFPFFSPYLFEVNRFDVISHAATAVVVIGFTAAAVFPSARRTSRLDPATLFRAT